MYHDAVTEMLSTTEHLDDVRLQVLATNAAFYAAVREEEAARRNGN